MGSGQEVLLQGFNWECTGEPQCFAPRPEDICLLLRQLPLAGQTQPSWYALLAAKAEVIAAIGITAVWLPPPSVSVSIEVGGFLKTGVQLATKPSHRQPSRPQGYMPRELEVLDAAYGSKTDLQSCITVMHARGLKVLADIVINHRCATYQARLAQQRIYGCCTPGADTSTMYRTQKGAGMSSEGGLTGPPQKYAAGMRNLVARVPPGRAKISQRPPTWTTPTLVLQRCQLAADSLDAPH